MPQRVCLIPACPYPAIRGGRCELHTKERERPPARPGAKVYALKRWKLTRQAYLLDHPLCEHEGCGEIATDVHHRIDIVDGGDPWAQENLQALCHSHHSKETNRRRKQRMSG